MPPGSIVQNGDIGHSRPLRPVARQQGRYPAGNLQITAGMGAVRIGDHAATTAVHLLTDLQRQGS